MKGSLESIQRQLNADVSEIALCSGSRGEFRAAALEAVCRAMGFDHGGLYSVGPDRIIAAQMWNIASEPITSRIGIYMGEMTPSEARRIGRGAVLDADLFGARRSKLVAYDEYIFRERVSGYIARLWKNRFGAFWTTLGRVGRATFSARDTELLDLVYRMIELGEALHAQPVVDNTSLQRDWATARSVTTAEWQVVDLVARGFTNPDIARLLGRPRNTVRNQLNRVFEKLNVTTRTELVMALHLRPADLPDAPGRRWRDWHAVLGRPETPPDE